MATAKSGANQAVQAERRRALIDATISAISTHGLSQLTLAKIAAGAGLTAGSVNFHFASKQALLLETLEFLARKFQQCIDATLEAAGPQPAAQLRALFDASLDPKITKPGDMAAWYAFTAAARGCTDYHRICGARDKAVFVIILKLCDELICQGGKGDTMNARAMANAVQSLMDEIGQETLYTGEQYDRKAAHFIALSFLSSVFPWAYSPPENPKQKTPQLSVKENSLQIERVEKSQLADASKLFDKYRQFYREPANAALAKKFLSENFRKDRSVIFMAQDQEDNALGFVQLYLSWCSVAAAPYWILYDLYVDKSARRRGVGQALMARAQAHAMRTKTSRIDLETATDNLEAQALYESLGYKRDTHFYKYSLDLA
ncbi:MAG: TetR/AcrR family bet gene transcriptional repressor [Halioglobus sp.]|jgi:TetR/AcrR family transcriptional repressor of bet genes